MTREQEIEEMAKVKASHITSDKDMQVAFADALRSGAEWADAHNEGLNMHIKYLKEELIDKACEWLKANLCEHYADEPIAHKMGRPISGYISFFEEPPVGVIMDFRKAMEGTDQ